MVTEDNDAALTDKLKTGRSAVLFMADWCGPCAMLMDALATTDHFKDYFKKNEIAVYYVDVDKLPVIARARNILSIPDMHFYRDGLRTGRIIGAVHSQVLLGQMNAAYNISERVHPS